MFDLSPRDRTESIGVVMQDPRSQFFMGTVGDEIAFSLENMGTDPSLTVKRVREAASLCGIEDLLDERLTELSSGQKQRVALAAATACHPQVLVLDEPTSTHRGLGRSSRSSESLGEAAWQWSSPSIGSISFCPWPTSSYIFGKDA